MRVFKNRTVIGILCIFFSLAICFGVAPLFNQSVSRTAEIMSGSYQQASFTPQKRYTNPRKCYLP